MCKGSPARVGQGHIKPKSSKQLEGGKSCGTYTTEREGKPNEALLKNLEPIFLKERTQTDFQKETVFSL